MDKYLPVLQDKFIGIVANHSTIIGQTHLVDSLLSRGVLITKIFSPEHGFRGDAADGVLIENDVDPRTGIPVISLYANKRKPSKEDLTEIDLMIFDIQDVGVRFYTYISTMHYLMEACAENGIPLMVLDRPNPNGFYVDGPILDTNLRSFVGMHPVPVVHGMTVGEFALMINGEGWLKNGAQCNLTVIPCYNYSHDSTYTLPVRPSPNLPNQTAVYLYPSLCFLEGTMVSIGRGTDFPFQVFGHPSFPDMGFYFIPESRPTSSINPPLKDQKCYGFDLRDYTDKYFLDTRSINLSWLIFAYQSFPQKDKFFNSYFNTLAGSRTLREQIEKGFDEQTIRSSWTSDIEQFMEIRQKYLLYPDFSR
jgi:uncharacterized protein YbbC (DUF1343 family)